MSTSKSFIWDEESRDLLLFDYLEGNLSEDKTAMLQQALAADPALQAELNSWQAGVVTAAFYPTGQLEEELLKIPQASPGLTYSGLAWSLVLLLLLSLLPSADHPLLLQSGQEEKQPQQQVQDGQQQPLPEVVAPAREAAGTLAEASRSSNASLPLQAQSPAPLQPEIARVEELPLLEPLSPEEEQVRLLVPKLQPLPAMEQPRQIAPKQISRQQARQIRKMKEKALQQRQANEFIKGNRPYVVPLEQKNF